MTELLEKLKTVFATTEPGLEIDKEFIQLRDDMKTRLNQGGRNDFKFTKDVDCLMLEEWLIKKNLVMATLDEHHESDGSCVYDCRIKLMNGVAFIDFKCVDEERNFNLGPEKFKNKPKFNNKSTMDWVHEGVVKGLLTDYCFYRMYRPEDRPLQENDVVTFELINVLNSRFVLKSLNDSVRNPGGKFYKVEKYV